MNPIPASDLRPIVASVRGVSQPGPRRESQAQLAHWPFVTISRQAGAGSRIVGKLLVDALNASLAHLHDPNDPFAGQTSHPWQFLDRELVERIASDHHLSVQLVDSLERSSHTWISEFFAGLRHTDHNPSELAIFHRVVETVRALARAGHVVLVGRGSVFITRDMPLGLHVRIIAPLEWRIKNFAQLEGLAEAEARRRVSLLDREREAFYRNFWPHLKLDSEHFDVTFNAATLSDHQMAATLLSLLRQKTAGPPLPRNPGPV